jgi:hypothetical protein
MEMDRGWGGPRSVPFSVLKSLKLRVCAAHELTTRSTPLVIVHFIYNTCI